MKKLSLLLIAVFCATLLNAAPPAEKKQPQGYGLLDQNSFTYKLLYAPEKLREERRQANIEAAKTDPLAALENESYDIISNFVSRSFEDYKKLLEYRKTKDTDIDYKDIAAAHALGHEEAREEVKLTYLNTLIDNEDFKVIDGSFDFNSLVPDKTKVVLIGESHSEVALMRLPKDIKVVNAKETLKPLPAGTRVVLADANAIVAAFKVLPRNTAIMLVLNEKPYPLPLGKRAVLVDEKAFCNGCTELPFKVSAVLKTVGDASAYAKMPEDSRVLIEAPDGEDDFDDSRLVLVDAKNNNKAFSALPSGHTPLVVGMVETQTYKEIPHWINSLKKSGRLKHFASEMLPTNLAPLIADFKNGKIDASALRPFETAEALERVEILNAARDINIIPLEDERVHFLGIKYKGKMKDTKLAKAILHSTGEGFTDFFARPDIVSIRNYFWMTQLEPYLKDNSLILLRAGIGHNAYMSHKGSMAERLNKRGLKTVVVEYINRKDDGTDYKGRSVLFTIEPAMAEIIGADYIVVIDR